MVRRGSFALCIGHTEPAIASARDDDDWSPDSDNHYEVESDADEDRDFDDWLPDELDLEIDDEPDPEPGDFWMDDVDEDD
jgi:hypothetical protein